MRCILLILLTAAVFAFVSTSNVNAEPTTYFSQSFNGADALSDPNFTDLGTRTLGPQGTSLFVQGGGSNDQQVFRLNLPAAPGNRKPGSPITATITVNQTIQQGDTDPIWGLADGTSFFGGFWEDNNGGSVQVIDADDNINYSRTNIDEQQNTGYPNSLDLGVVLTLNDSGTDVDASINASTASASGLTALNANNLNLVFATQDAGGGDHLINNFSIELSTEIVPEPASVAIWSLIGLGLVGFGVYRTRRKK